MERYVAEPRGRFARMRWHRAVVRDSETGGHLRVRSRVLAEEIAGALAHADAGMLPRRTTPETPFDRYLCAEQVPGTFRLFRTHGALVDDAIAVGSDGDPAGARLPR